MASAILFSPKYRDGEPLEADHLNDLAQWSCEIVQSLVGELLGFGDEGGIIWADAGEDAAAHAPWSARLDHATIHWSRHVLALGPGQMAIVLASQEPREPSDQTVLSVGEIEKRSCKCTLTQSSTRPLYTLREHEVRCAWPIAFIGSTPALRSSLQSFRQALRETLQTLDKAYRMWRPWLVAAANLQDRSALPTAMPVLRVLADALQISPSFEDWPNHDELRAFLERLSQGVEAWRESDPRIEFVEEAELAGGRQGRRYRKRAGALLQVLGVAGHQQLADAARGWSVAQMLPNGMEGDPQAQVEVEADWQEFVVRWSQQSPSGKLRFTDGVREYEQ